MPGPIQSMCAEHPVMLAAEDLPWADEPSLRLRNRLARRASQIPLLLTGTGTPLPAGLSGLP
jgi:predicted ATPase